MMALRAKGRLLLLCLISRWALGSSSGLCPVGQYYDFVGYHSTDNTSAVGTVSENVLGWIVSPCGNFLYYAHHALAAKVYKYDIASQTTEFLAGDSTGGFQDGIGAAAAFAWSGQIAFGQRKESLLLGDAGNHAIRKIDLATNEVSTIAGTGTAGGADGVGINASFYSPYGIAMRADHEVAFITERDVDRIRKIVLATNEVSTVATASNGVVKPLGMAVSGDGSTLYTTSDAGAAFGLYKTVVATGVTTLVSASTQIPASRYVRSLFLTPDESWILGSYFDSGTKFMKFGLRTGSAIDIAGSRFGTGGSGAFAASATGESAFLHGDSVFRVDFPAAKDPGCESCPAISSTASFRNVTWHEEARLCQFTCDGSKGFVADYTTRQCTCMPGWTSFDGITCQQCEPGTYKTTAGFSGCRQCPAMTTSLAGSTNASDCIDRCQSTQPLSTLFTVASNYGLTTVADLWGLAVSKLNDPTAVDAATQFLVDQCWVSNMSVNGKLCFNNAPSTMEYCVNAVACSSN